jgi:FkbM family methyltransferase
VRIPGINRLYQAATLVFKGVDPSDAHARRAYAQEGEDLVLASLFEGRDEPGFYVDVGAFDPHRYSNTFYFYRRGWRGINIEPRQGSKAIFDAARPRDINLEMAVADRATSLEYIEFDEACLNGCDAAVATNRLLTTPYREIGRRRVQAFPLRTILDEHLPHGQEIAFLSIDVEGLDYQVLTSNDWARHRPLVVAAEDLNCKDLARIESALIAVFLREQGYHPVAKTPRTTFFARD